MTYGTLDGGRLQTFNLKDLYRRVINRNNRLKRLLELEPGEIIVRNEKRASHKNQLCLIDNGREDLSRCRNRLKIFIRYVGVLQQGRSQNLLGKRVDLFWTFLLYVVGPELKYINVDYLKKW